MNAQQLKNSILQMAIQGKLVPQDPNDEPASVLIERIREEKEKLIKEKKIKKEKNPSFIFRGTDNITYEKIGKNEPISIEDELPFEIPDSWEWVRIHTISNPIGSKNNQIRSKEVLHIGKIPVVSQSKDLIDGYSNQTEKKINILPLVMFGDHTRNVKYIDFEFIIGADGTKFHQIIGCNPKYIFFWMQYAAETLRNRGYARHYSLLKEQYIPIPPLCEQSRIVDKLEELLPLFERYGNKQNSLDKLKNDFPVLLKKSILQEAVQGKLVPQDPNDEPASVLLERIRAEKQKLIKEGKIKKDKNESIIYRRDNSHYEKRASTEICIDTQLPFNIPDSWEWCYLGNIAFITKLAGFEYTKFIAPNLTDSGIPLFKGKNVQNGNLVLNFEGYIPEQLSDKLFRSQVTSKCLLTPYVGTIGNIAIFDGSFKAHLGSNVGKIELINPIEGTCVSEEYVLHYLRSPVGYQQLTKQKKATAQESISIDAIRNVLIPIPPFKEQMRIIHKIFDLNKKVQAL